MKRNLHTGFTLIEMLVSIAILGILMVAILTMTSLVNKTWVAGDKKTEVLQIGRAVLSRISKDLTQASLVQNSPTTLCDTGTEVNLLPDTFQQFVQNPPLPITTVSGTDSLFWQAPIARVNSTSSTIDPLALVGYYVTDNKSGFGPKRSLNRFYVEPPPPTPGSAIPSTTPGYFLYQNNPDSKTFFWLNASGMATALQPWDSSQFLTTKPTSTVLSENVLGLWIRCRKDDGQPIPYPTATDPSSPSGVKYDSNWKGTGHRLPYFVEVTVVCMDSRSLVRLKQSDLPAIPNPTDSREYENKDYITYTDSINTFVSDLRKKVPDSEVRAFTSVVRLQNGSYDNPSTYENP